MGVSPTKQFCSGYSYITRMHEKENQQETKPAGFDLSQPTIEKELAERSKVIHASQPRLSIHTHENCLAPMPHKGLKFVITPSPATSSNPIQDKVANRGAPSPRSIVSKRRVFAHSEGRPSTRYKRIHSKTATPQSRGYRLTRLSTFIPTPQW